MNIKPSSINSGFNREFQAIYKIYLELDTRSAELNRVEDKSYDLPERKAHADVIDNFCKTFEAFAQKYIKHAETLAFTPETIAQIPPEKLAQAMMEDLLKLCSTVTRFNELESTLKKLLP